MSALLKFFDEQFGSGPSGRQTGGELRLASRQVTPRDIIAHRIASEIDSLNAQSQAGAQSLSRTRSFLIGLEPGSAEDRLNPTLGKAHRGPMLDAATETARAIEAFERRRFLMLVDDRQIDHLDEGVALMPESDVTFLYLTPLKGG